MILTMTLLKAVCPGYLWPSDHSPSYSGAEALSTTEQHCWHDWSTACIHYKQKQIERDQSCVGFFSTVKTACCFPFLYEKIKSSGDFWTRRSGTELERQNFDLVRSEGCFPPQGRQRGTFLPPPRQQHRDSPNGSGSSLPAPRHPHIAAGWQPSPLPALAPTPLWHGDSPTQK